jgi:large subunit ribosomal protein L4
MTQTKNFTLPIYDSTGKETDTVKLDTAIFNGLVNKDVLHQAVVAFRANQRRGLAATKTRGEVSGGGRKPWKQKGTGRARVGSTRSPLWRHGGVIFGPHPRDFSYSLPKKIKNLALRSALNVKVNENNFMVLDNFKLAGAKTKEAVAILKNLKIELNHKKDRLQILILLDKIDKNIKLALRNISFSEFNLAKDVNAYEVLSARKILITKDGLRQLTERIK